LLEDSRHAASLIGPIGRPSPLRRSIRVRPRPAHMDGRRPDRLRRRRLHHAAHAIRTRSLRKGPPAPTSRCSERIRTHRFSAQTPAHKTNQL